MTQVVDPSVSRAKFDREIAEYREMEALYVARGIWLMKAEFPVAKVAFAAVNLRPRTIVAAIEVDFTDYDLRPLSVRFVDPFEDRPIGVEEMGTMMPRLDPAASAESINAARMQLAPWPAQPIVQAHPGGPPFLCLPGVREYHEHPAHSGDPWEFHRSAGEGKLFNILEKVWRYGSAPMNVTGIQVLQYQLVLSQSEVPA